MTRVTILGEAQGAEPEKKKIEFVKCIESNSIDTSPGIEPEDWDFVMLICKNYNNEGFDAMLAWDGTENDRDAAVMFLGHFNDGVV